MPDRPTIIPEWYDRVLKEDRRRRRREVLKEAAAGLGFAVFFFAALFLIAVL